MEIVATKQDFVRADLEPWRIELKRAIRDPVELCRRLNLPTSLGERGELAQGPFRTFCPEAFLSRIVPGDPDDPLLLQVLPRIDELEQTAEQSADPLNEKSFELAPGVLQKYAGRVLLIATGVCAIHCRYCFRRYFPYGEAPKSLQQWESALESIERDLEIQEVILSGGDPLMLVDSTLSELMKQIDGIPHVKRIRIHTRLPIMIPQRINAALTNLFSKLRAKVVVVIHSNHAAEIDHQVADSLAAIRSSGAQLLNQSVLLRGVNDEVQTLVALSERLVDVGVVPYYLHELDPVFGTQHFQVPREKAISLVEKMRARVSGYLVPRLVVEEPGQLSKRVLV